MTTRLLRLPFWNPESYWIFLLQRAVFPYSPEPEIYLLAARRLGLAPDECVFVDDMLANVEGAREVGMVGMLHRHPDITIPNLEELLGISLT